jgi:hypothetical protein
VIIVEIFAHIDTPVFFAIAVSSIKKEGIVVRIDVISIP